MRISEFFINGFGIFRDQHVDNLAPGLNLFVGNNEAGKSTLLSFFRAILFGFETGVSRENAYKPAAGGEHGGLISVTMEKDGQEYRQEYRIERGPGRAQGRVIVRGQNLEAEGEEAVARLIPGVTKDLFKSVFAFSLDELQSVASLKAEDVKSRIYSYGAGSGLVSAIDVEQQITREMESLFAPRGQRAINQQIAALNENDRVIKELSTKSSEYDQLKGQLDVLQREISAATAEIETLRQKVLKLEQIEKAWEDWTTLITVRDKLTRLADVSSFPADGIGRLDRFRDKLSEMEGKLQRNRDELEAEKSRLNSLHSSQSAADDLHALHRKQQALADARAALTNTELLNIQIKAVTQRLADLQNRRRGLESTLESDPAKSTLSFYRWIGGATSALLLIGAFIRISDIIIALLLAGAGTAILVWTFLAQNRLKAAQDVRAKHLREELIETTQALDEAQRELDTAEKKKEAFQRSLQSAEEALKRQISTLEDLNVVERDLTDAVRVTTKREEIQNGIERMSREILALEREILQTREECRKLFAAGGAADEESFRTRAALHDEAVALERRREECERNLRLLLGCEDLSQIENELANADLLSIRLDLGESNRQLVETEAKLASMREQHGRISQMIDNIERSEELSSALMHDRALKASLEKSASQWAVRALVKEMMRKAREHYEREKQPRVVRNASHYLQRITNGAYTGLFSPLGQDDVRLETPQGLHKETSILSRGTREQLYLSLRFGLIREYCDSAEPLPVIMDDILVNFDPERAKSTAEAIMDLAGWNQVMFFTCHPETVEMFREIDQSICCFEIGQGQIRRSTLT